MGPTHCRSSCYVFTKPGYGYSQTLHATCYKSHTGDSSTLLSHFNDEHKGEKLFVLERKHHGPSVELSGVGQTCYYH